MAYQLIRHDGQVFVIPPGGATIGRSSSNTISLANDTTVSRHHAKVILSQGRVWIRDENSSGGVFINGQRIQGQQELHPHAVLQIGSNNFKLAEIAGARSSRAVVANKPKRERLAPARKQIDWQGGAGVKECNVCGEHVVPKKDFNWLVFIFLCGIFYLPFYYFQPHYCVKCNGNSFSEISY